MCHYTSSAAPKNYGGLPVGRNTVDRLDWRLWSVIQRTFSRSLDYGDFCVMHPDLTEPPGIAMARASVSARYTVDDEWIIYKGTSTTGARGQPMHDQYLSHASSLVAEGHFGGLTNCYGDQRIQHIAAGLTSPGNRTVWVEISLSRHICFILDRLP